MEHYSLGVALFDYLPVVATATALWWLALGIAHRHPSIAPVALAAALLIPFGGFCKATWKLLIALEFPQLDWLNNVLFLALAPGFAAMAFCLVQASGAWRSGTSPNQASFPIRWLLFWAALPLLGAAAVKAAQPESRAWFFLLLACTTVGNIVLTITAARLSRWSGLSWAIAGCFIYSLVASLAMGGLARLPPGESTAWIQEAVNLSSQLALAIGAFALSRRMRNDQAVTPA